MAADCSSIAILKEIANRLDMPLINATNIFDILDTAASFRRYLEVVEGMPELQDEFFDSKEHLQALLRLNTWKLDFQEAEDREVIEHCLGDIHIETNCSIFHLLKSVGDIWLYDAFLTPPRLQFQILYEAGMSLILGGEIVPRTTETTNHEPPFVIRTMRRQIYDGLEYICTTFYKGKRNGLEIRAYSKFGGNYIDIEMFSDGLSYGPCLRRFLTDPWRYHYFGIFPHIFMRHSTLAPLIPMQIGGYTIAGHKSTKQEYEKHIDEVVQCVLPCVHQVIISIVNAYAFYIDSTIHIEI